MRYLRTALKFLGAILIYAVAVAAFYISFVFGILLCDQYKWLIEKPSDDLWDVPVALPYAMLTAPALLVLFYLAQVILWGMTGRVIRLRYRLGLDALFGLSYALLVCLSFDDFRWPRAGRDLLLCGPSARPDRPPDVRLCAGGGPRGRHRPPARAASAAARAAHGPCGPVPRAHPPGAADARVVLCFSHLPFFSAFSAFSAVKESGDDRRPPGAC